MENTALNGIYEICLYMRKSRNTLLKYVREEGFPASKIGGVWISDKTQVDMWRHQKISEKLIKN